MTNLVAFIAKKKYDEDEVLPIDMSGNSPFSKRAVSQTAQPLRRICDSYIAIRNYNENATVPCYSGRDFCQLLQKTAAPTRNARQQRRSEKRTKTKEFTESNTRKRPIPLAANAQKGGAATARSPRTCLMAMHELIAARFPVKAHAQAAQHDHANHAMQNRRERVLRAICPQAPHTKRRNRPARLPHKKLLAFENARHLPSATSRNARRQPPCYAQRNGHHETGAAGKVCAREPATANKPTEKRIGHNNTP